MKDEKDNVYLAMCDDFNATLSFSVHKTREGAQKALDEDEKKKRAEAKSIVDKRNENLKKEFPNYDPDDWQQLQI
jgi:hypothetical protein